MPVPPTGVFCSVKARRQRLGWTQEELARRIHVRRQAVYDIESGRYLPNTAVALRLARVFGCAVEDIFSLERPRNDGDIRLYAKATAPQEGEGRHLPPGMLLPDDQVVLGRVRDTLVGFSFKQAPPMGVSRYAADAFVTGRGEIECLTAPGIVDNTLIILGCNPALALLDAQIRRIAPSARVRCLFASSAKSLAALARGEAHAAAVHYHGENGRANVIAAREQLAGMPGSITGFSLNEEGIMVAPGNPLEIRSVADLTRSGLRFCNREPGAALRNLLDSRLREEGIAAEAVAGYFDCVYSHDEGALSIIRGGAHAALGLGITAQTHGLDFVPLAVTRCDLIVPKDLAGHPGVRVLLDVLHSSRLRREIDAVHGYDAAQTGKEIADVP